MPPDPGGMIDRVLLSRKIPNDAVREKEQTKSDARPGIIREIFAYAYSRQSALKAAKTELTIGLEVWRNSRVKRSFLGETPILQGKSGIPPSPLSCPNLGLMLCMPGAPRAEQLGLNASKEPTLAFEFEPCPRRTPKLVSKMREASIQMRHLIFASAVIAASLCNPAAQAAAPAECFASSGAVFAAHPDATHASYVVHGKRCWFADAFKKEAKANPTPASHSAAPATRTSALRHATTAPVPEPRTTAVAPAASLPAMVQFPREMPPAIQIAVNAQELSRLLPDDERPADFESRFSVSGYKVRK
jgi:hypothetical protein